MRAIVLEMNREWGARYFPPPNPKITLAISFYDAKVIGLPVEQKLFDSLKCGDVVEIEIRKAPK